MYALTKDYNVENQDDKSDDTATSAVLPGVSVTLSGDWGGGDKGEEEELDEHMEDVVVQHFEIEFGLSIWLSKNIEKDRVVRLVIRSGRGYA
jgi:hypothetical protein